MIRKLALGWVCPVAGFWIWHYLAMLDIGPGIFSRAFHHWLLSALSNVVGVEPELFLPMLAKGILADALIVGAVLAFARRRKLVTQYRCWRLGQSQPAMSGRESLSNAP